MKKVKRFLTEHAIYVVLIVLTVAIAIYNPKFISVDVLRDILMQSSTRVIIALGAAFVLITGGVELSAGRMVGFSAVISASMLQTADYSRLFYPGLPQLALVIPILVAVAVGLVVGLMNGLNPPAP